jgi:hypothetical protein
MLASTFLVSKAEARIAGSWTGTTESALRTLAALQIIDAAELAYSLKYAEQFRANARCASPRNLSVAEQEP